MVKHHNRDLKEVHYISLGPLNIRFIHDGRYESCQILLDPQLKGV